MYTSIIYTLLFKMYCTLEYTNFKNCACVLKSCLCFSFDVALTQKHNYFMYATHGQNDKVPRNVWHTLIHLYLSLLSDYGNGLLSYHLHGCACDE